MAKHKQKEIRSVSDLLKLMKSEVNTDSTTWFRGHDDIEWKLEPSLNRQRYKKPIESAVTLYKRFTQNAVKMLPSKPRDEYEWLFYMQHYGIPTHLLDWSESPLIALYFAVHDAKFSKKDGALYFLDPVEFNDHAGHAKSENKEIFSFGIDPSADEYLLTKLNAGNPKSKTPPIAIIGSKDSIRIQAQEGVFVAHHHDMLWMENEFPSCSWAWRHKIPKESKKEILQELGLLLIDHFTVYPQLDHLARRIKETLK